MCEKPRLFVIFSQSEWASESTKSYRPEHYTCKTRNYSIPNNIGNIPASVDFGNMVHTIVTNYTMNAARAVSWHAGGIRTPR
jgi:hypothetical protein